MALLIQMSIGPSFAARGGGEHRLFVADIQRQGQRLPAGSLDLRAQRLQCLRLARDEADLRAFPGQVQGDGAAHAGRGTGHHRGLAAQAGRGAPERQQEGPEHHRHLQGSEWWAGSEANPTGGSTGAAGSIKL
jgi:hypothetical protein